MVPSVSGRKKCSFQIPAGLCDCSILLLLQDAGEMLVPGTAGLCDLSILLLLWDAGKILNLLYGNTRRRKTASETGYQEKYSIH